MPDLENHEYFMARALRLAERGLYTTQPNPRVGCVLVKDNRIVGEGFHIKAGEAHAEVNALRDAGSNAKGATAYITLEPCSFSGRTGACTEALIKSGVGKVVCASLDPHPKVSGGGVEILKAAGIEVIYPFLESSAKKINPGSIKRHEKFLPYVRCKLAMSLDGKISLSNGKSKWITSSEARKDVQKLRAQSSAIITGVQTVIDDDPSMTVRENELNIDASFGISAKLIASIPRIRVVLDSKGRLPAGAAILKGPMQTLVATTNEHYPLKGVKTLLLPASKNDKVDLASLLAELAKLEANEVLFECGPGLAGSLLEEGLLDELIIYMSGKIFGNQGRSLFEMSEIFNIDDAPKLKIMDVHHLGEDLKLTCRI